MNVKSWNTYRTRFLVRARQLTEPLVFTDSLGREHSGKVGDYLVETSDGLRRITTRALFEDIYVPLASDPAPPSISDVQNLPETSAGARAIPRTTGNERHPASAFSSQTHCNV